MRALVRAKAMREASSADTSEDQLDHIRAAVRPENVPERSTGAGRFPDDPQPRAAPPSAAAAPPSTREGQRDPIPTSAKLRG